MRSCLHACARAHAHSAAHVTRAHVLLLLLALCADHVKYALDKKDPEAATEVSRTPYSKLLEERKRAFSA